MLPSVTGQVRAAGVSDQPADPDSDHRADERSPQVELAKWHAIQAQIATQRFRNQAQPLRTARQGPDHGNSRDKNGPSPIEPARR